MSVRKLSVNPFNPIATVFACKVPGKNKWKFSESVEELRPVANRTAKQLGLPIKIFRVVHNRDRARPESFLIVRRVVGVQNNGDKEIEWAQVDSEDAAKTLGDVSHGPTPYLPLKAEETFNPA